jgi:hypothetical protein
MGLPVVTVAAGGLAVVDVTSVAPTSGLPVTEATNGRGVAVTKVTGGKPGMPVVYDTIGVVAPVVYATLDPATVTAVTLSGGNLVATNTGTTSPDQGAHVAASSGKSTGKYYFEVRWTTVVGGANFGIGIGTTASTYTNMGSGGTTGDVAYRGDNVYSNGSVILASLGGAWSQGQTICVAADLDNRRIWFRQAPAGNWNNNATYSPVTNVGGLAVPAGAMVPFATFGGGSGLANNAVTFNLGASAFLGAVPSGFTPGWPA